MGVGGELVGFYIIDYINCFKGWVCFYLMKVHKYQFTVYGGVLSFVHGDGASQTRLYFPKQGVLGFRGEEVDFFSDGKKIVAEAEKVISGKGKDNEKYEGSLNLSDDVVMSVICLGKEANVARERFERAAKSLVGLLG